MSGGPSWRGGQPAESMGVGDNIMASGMARGAAKRGKRIAFGDGRKIIWDQNSEIVFRGNPNVAPPGTEKSRDIEWIAFHRGNRIYNAPGPGKWIWNYDFRPTPGEFYFTAEEKRFAEAVGEDFVVIEPNVPSWKTVASNKQWPVERYDAVALTLRIIGYDVVQFDYGPGHRIAAARQVKTHDFRRGAATLSRAALYIGPEGGLHHAAAAVKTPAVVLFGGFIPPAVTGYDDHTNLDGGAEACGSLSPCRHCRGAMAAISADEVIAAAKTQLGRLS